AYLADSHHDRYVASRLPRASIFQGVVGQSLESLRAARRLGCRTVLDVITAHVDQFAEQQQRECARFGIRPSLHPRHRERIALESQQADLIRVMSHVARQTFVERGFPPERVVVAAPPFDLAEFPVCRLDDPTFRVGFAGLLEPWKGFHYLIEAYNRL